MPPTTLLTLGLCLMLPPVLGAPVVDDVIPPPERGAPALPLGKVDWWRTGTDGAPTVEGMRGKVFLIQTYAFFCDT